MSKLYSYLGQSLTISQIARSTGLRPQTLDARLRRGVGLELAIMMPPQSRMASGRVGASRSPWIRIGYFRK
jgi:hypothetical protein